MFNCEPGHPLTSGDVTWVLSLQNAACVHAGAVTPREQGVLSSQQSLERPASAPLPAAVADAAAAAAAAELSAGEGTRSAGAQPPSTEAVRDAAIAALALAERRSVRFSADLPRSDSASLLLADFSAPSSD